MGTVCLKGTRIMTGNGAKTLAISEADLRALFVSFAAANGGEFSTANGISDAELECCQSDFLQWMGTIFSALHKEPRSPTDDTRELLDEHYRNLYVFCKFRNHTIQFHVRYGANAVIENPDLTVTFFLVPLREFKFYLEEQLSVVKSLPPLRRWLQPIIANEFSIPQCFKVFFPKGYLKSHGLKFPTSYRLTIQQLHDLYSAYSNDRTLGEAFANNSTFQECLARMVHFQHLSIGKGDWRNGTNRTLWELDLTIDSLAVEPMQRALELAHVSITLLEELGIIQSEQTR